MIIDVMESVTKRTCTYLESEFKINAIKNNSESGKLESIALLDMTTLIVVSTANVNLLVIFSFEKPLINWIFHEMTDGLGIKDYEIDRYRKAAAGDVINTVLGNSTIDLEGSEKKEIHITPQKILDNVKTIQEMGYSMFYAQHLDTPLGKMTIFFVGSDELFSKNFCVVNW